VLNRFNISVTQYRCHIYYASAKYCFGKSIICSHCLALCIMRFVAVCSLYDVLSPKYLDSSATGLI